MYEDLEKEITDLTETYYRLIGSEHHKDRDCHWYIKRVWSYGNSPYWRVEHYGYVYEAKNSDPYDSYVDEKHTSYEDALRGLRWHLKEAIDVARGYAEIGYIEQDTGS